MPSAYLPWASTASIVSSAVDVLSLVVLVPLLIYQSLYVARHRRFQARLKRQLHAACRWLLCPLIATVLAVHSYADASVMQALRHLQLYTLMLCVLLWCDSLASHLQRQSAMQNQQHAAEMGGVGVLQQFKWMWVVPVVGTVLIDGLRCGCIYAGYMDEDDLLCVVLDQWSNAGCIATLLSVAWSQWFYMRKMDADISSTITGSKPPLLMEPDDLEERRSSVTPSISRSVAPSAISSPVKPPQRHLVAAGSVVSGSFVSSTPPKRSSGPLSQNEVEEQLARHGSMSILLTADAQPAPTVTQELKFIGVTQDDSATSSQRQHTGLQLNRHRRSQTAADMPRPTVQVMRVPATTAVTNSALGDAPSQIADVIAAANSQPRSDRRATLTNANKAFTSTNAVLLSPRHTNRTTLTPTPLATTPRMLLPDGAEPASVEALTGSISMNRTSTQLQLLAPPVNRASGSLSASPGEAARPRNHQRHTSRHFPSTMIAIDQLTAPNVTMRRLGKSYTFLYLSLMLEALQLVLSILYIVPSLRLYWYVGSSVVLNLGVVGLTAYAWTARWPLEQSSRENNTSQLLSTSQHQQQQRRATLRASHSTLLLTPTHRTRNSLEMPLAQVPAMTAVGALEPIVPANKVLPLMSFPLLAPPIDLPSPHGTSTATTITHSLQGSYELSYVTSPRVAGSSTQQELPQPSLDATRNNSTTMSSDAAADGGSHSSDGVSSRRSTGRSSLRNMQLRLSNVREDVSGEASRGQSVLISAPTSARPSFSPRPSHSTAAANSHQPLWLHSQGTAGNNIAHAATPAASTTFAAGLIRRSSVLSSIVGRLRKTSLSTVVSSNGKSDTLSTSTQNQMISSQRSSDNMTAGMHSEQHWQPQVSSTRRNSVAVSYDAAAMMAAAAAATADFMEAEEAVASERESKMEQRKAPASSATYTACATQPSRLSPPRADPSLSVAPAAPSLVPVNQRTVSFELQMGNRSPRSQSTTSALSQHNVNRDSLQASIASTTNQSQISQWSYPSSQQLHSFSTTTNQRGSGKDFLSVSGMSIVIPTSPSPTSMSRGVSSISRAVTLKPGGRCSPQNAGKTVQSSNSHKRQQSSSEFTKSIAG